MTAAAPSEAIDQTLVHRSRRWGSWYVAEHRLRTLRTYWKTLLFTTIADPFFYLFALGVGLATLVSKNSSAAFDGQNYLVYVAPALVCSAAVNAAVQECTYPILVGFKWNHIFEGMNAAPISGRQIVNGVFLSIIARLLAISVIYYLVMLLFGALPSLSGALVILIATATGMAFGFVVASYMATIQNDVGQPAFIMRFIVMPLFLFSGSFFPISRMPIYLQWIGWISPLWHGSQLGRAVSYGLAEPGWLVVIHVVYLLGLIIFGWVLTQRVFVRRLDK